MPARESHYKEAPYPRSKKYEEKKKTPEEYVTGVEDKDPVWLKDKADHAFKKHDFHAAIANYSKALENDRDFLMARLNRVTCFMKMRQFVAAVEECDVILQQVSNLDKKEREGEKVFYDKIVARATLKRAASQAWIGQFEQSLADFAEAQKADYADVFTEEQRERIGRDAAMV